MPSTFPFYTKHYSKITFNGFPFMFDSTLPITTDGAKNSAAVSTLEGIILSGGENTSGNLSTVIKITPNFEKISFQNLTTRRQHAGEKIGNLAAFTGGRTAYDWYTTEGYNPKTGEKFSLPNLVYARSDLKGASDGKITRFVGGKDRDSRVWNTIDTFYADLTHSYIDHIYSVTEMGVCCFGGRIYVVGGWNPRNGNYYSFVYSYDSDGTRNSHPSLLIARKGVVCATIGNKYMLAGFGVDANGVIRNEIEIYDSAGSRTTVLRPSLGLVNVVGLSFDDCAIFCGGKNGAGPSQKAYLINDSLQMFEISLEDNRVGGVGGVIGRDAILLHGCSDTNLTYYNTSIRYLRVPRDIYIPKGAKYKFGNMSDEVTAATSTRYTITSQELSGYLSIPDISF